MINDWGCSSKHGAKSSDHLPADSTDITNETFALNKIGQRSYSVVIEKFEFSGKRR
jgi:hypothetical protein